MPPCGPALGVCCGGRFHRPPQRGSVRLPIVLVLVLAACAQPEPSPPAPAAPPGPAPVASAERCLIGGVSLEFEHAVAKEMRMQIRNLPPMESETLTSALRRGPEGQEYVATMLFTIGNDALQVYAVGHIDPGTCAATVATWETY